MEYTDNKFPKKFRLTGKKSAELLFKGSQNVYKYPIKIFFRKEDSIDNSKILISVPKKNFPKAVDRNLIKRRIRESYRKYKTILSSLNQKYEFAVVYIAKEKLTFQEIEIKLVFLLQQLAEKKLQEGKN
jgi:ribonuclease P protein component